MSASSVATEERTAASTFPMGTLFLVLLVILGIVAAIVRYTQGLGAATNLRDGVPWGLWIGLDVMTGVALSAGGFTMAAVVYIFRLKRYYPLLRPALLTALIGYLLAAGAILFDLGRPERFYHPFLYWNPHSVMFEIAWSVIIYLTILMVENSQLVAERFQIKWLLRLLRLVLIPVVTLGIIISTMHQSSLGGLFLLVPQRLYPLWYTPLLPLLFYMTAIVVGFSMTIIESLLTASAYDRPPEMNLLRDLGQWIMWLLLAYLVVNLGVIVFSGKGALLFQPQLGTAMYWTEIGIGVILPLIILAQPRLRDDRVWLFRAAVLAAIGVVLNRFDVLFWGLGGVTYSPSWMEFAVSAGLIALGILLFMFAVKRLPVFDQHATDH
ncbi:MAG: Ni/Fe-hydrogenase cytochrome b subunit [Anaerolineae bacterium]